MFAAHAFAWVAVYGFWLWATRAYHPTLSIAAAATFLLVASFAAAFYLDRLVLASRLAGGRRLAALLAVEMGLNLAVVAAIQLVYDAMWGPDPRRFGFSTNVATDFLGMHLHVVAARWIAARIGRSR